jgi:16S rRNA (cytosine967-C5)-methyltransferase
VTVLQRVWAGSYADRALRGEATHAGLDARERGFATQLVYGAVQRRRTLDHVIEQFTARPVDQLDGAVLDALRLGTLQLLYLDGVATHAAVDQSVELAKEAGGPGYKLVNAVLRKVAAEGAAVLEALHDRTPLGAAVKHSVPDWLAELWWDELGADEARALLATINEPAETAYRVNTLVTTREEALAALAQRGVTARVADDVPHCLLLDEPFALTDDPLWASGALVPQSRSAQRAALLLAPEPGMRVLDLCAAPGGKTTHLAALVGVEGEVVAVERNRGRAEALARACERLRATNVRIETGDATRPRDDAPFDAVLVDPPCSGLGTLQGRPDLRWGLRPEAIDEMAAAQREILGAGLAALKPGGALVYSTCTISRRENEDVVAGAEPRQTTQLLPHRDGSDGFFLARF